MLWYPAAADCVFHRLCLLRDHFDFVPKSMDNCDPQVPPSVGYWISRRSSEPAQRLRTGQPARARGVVLRVMA